MYSPRIVRLTDEHVPGTTDHSFTRENARKCSIGCCRLCCRKTLHPGCHGLWSSNRYLCFQNSVVISELCSRDWQPPNPASNYSGAGWQSPPQRTKSEKERKETKQLNEKKIPRAWPRRVAEILHTTGQLILRDAASKFHSRERVSRMQEQGPAGIKRIPNSSENKMVQDLF